MAVSPDDVRSREDLRLFLEALAGRADVEPLDWENDTLPRFISAAARWVTDMDGWFKWAGQDPPNEPTWALIAMIFEAATAYE